MINSICRCHVKIKAWCRPGLQAESQNRTVGVVWLTFGVEVTKISCCKSCVSNISIMFGSVCINILLLHISPCIQILLLVFNYHLWKPKYKRNMKQAFKCTNVFFFFFRGGRLPLFWKTTAEDTRRKRVEREGMTCYTCAESNWRPLQRTGSLSTWGVCSTNWARGVPDNY